MKALVGAFNQEKALVGAFSEIVETDGSFAALDAIILLWRAGGTNPKAGCVGDDVERDSVTVGQAAGAGRVTQQRSVPRAAVPVTAPQPLAAEYVDTIHTIYNI